MTRKSMEQVRRDFWVYYLAHTKLVTDKPKFDSNLWVPMTPEGDVVLSLGIRQTGGATVFLRGRIDAPVDTAGPRLTPYEADLKKMLLTAFKHQSDANAPYYFRKTNPKADFTLPSRWPVVTEWFDKSAASYRQIIEDVPGFSK